MLYKVQVKDGELQITPSQLLEQLMAKHMSISRRDFEVLSVEFANFMQSRQALHEASLLQIILIAFSLGYFYRVFKEKNEVEVIHDHEPPTS